MNLHISLKIILINKNEINLNKPLEILRMVLMGFILVVCIKYL